MNRTRRAVRKLPGIDTRIWRIVAIVNGIILLEPRKKARQGQWKTKQTSSRTRVTFWARPKGTKKIDRRFDRQ